MTDTTDTTTAESSDMDDQRAVFPQSKSRRVKRTAEFLSEKYADEERTFIDPKGNGDPIPDAQNLDVSSINPLEIPNGSVDERGSQPIAGDKS